MKRLLAVVLLCPSVFVACSAGDSLTIGAGASLVGADLSEQSLAKRDLAGANLTEADLSGSDLSGADLRGANLTGANLTGTSLMNADLRGANMTGVIVGGTDFTGATLDGAAFDQESLGSQRGAPTTTTSTSSTTSTAAPTTSTTAAPRPTTTLPPPPPRTLVNIRIVQVGIDEYFGGEKVIYTCVKYFDYSDGTSEYEMYKQENNPC